MSPSTPAEQAKKLIKVPEMRRIKHIHFVGIGGAGVWYCRSLKEPRV